MSTSSADAKIQLLKILRDDEVLQTTMSAFNINAEELSIMMFQMCILSADMKDLFTSLDHSRVDHQLQVRYLLRLVSEKVKEDESVWEKFLSFLDSMGKRQLCEYLESKHNSAKATPPEMEELCSNMSLVKEDINWLLETLITVSHKWELLGIALSLAKHEIQNCRNEHDNKMSLSNVLSSWLSGCGAKVHEVTLSKLKEVLGSETMGEHVVAEQLAHRFREIRKVYIATPVVSDDPSFTLVHQSNDITVDDGRSTLLQVQTSSRQSVSYEWRKDGQPLLNDCTYSGVHDDILVVSHASQGTEGEYTCCVSSSEREVCSNKITLTVLYTPAKKRLPDLYSVRGEIPPDSWPRDGTKSFINLVLTSTGSDHYTNSDLSVIENADELMATKGDLLNEQIFCKYGSKRLIFVEGRPGSGKTTLIHKVVKDWTIGKLLLNARLVMMITLRNLNNFNEESLSSLVSFFYPTDQEIKSMTSDIESANGEGICFIFDGLDEYKPQDRHKSVIYKLLDKTYLPLAMIIVASRPAAIESLRQDAITQRIEVFGFTRENILEYIEHFPFKKNVFVDNLKEYLHSHPNVFDMCYLPVHAAMICFLYNREKVNLPSTQTITYEEFTKSMILRHLFHHNIRFQIRSLKELPSDFKKYFCNVCLLAFNMTVQSKQVVSPDEIGIPLSIDAGHDDQWSLGLVDIRKVACTYGINETYSFPHITFQEFLTAYHIATQEKKERMKILRNTELCKSMSTTVWKFYCGLVTFQDRQEVQMVFEKLRTYSPDIKSMHHAFESQQQMFCNEVVKRLNGELKYYNLTPSDMSALGYVICSAFHPITSLHVHHTQLLEHISSKNFGNLVTLEIVPGINSSTRLLALAGVLKSCSMLKYARLTFGDLSYPGTKNVADSFKHLKNLKQLCVTFESTSIGLTTLLDGLQHLTSAKLSLSIYRFNRSGFSELCNGLEHLKKINIHKMELFFSTLTPDNATCFARALQSCIKLETVAIKHVSFEDTGFCATITSALGKKLKSLTLSDTNMGSDGAIAFSHKLQNLLGLEVLDLSHNGIGPEGAASVANALGHLKNLKIDLTGNDLYQDNVMSTMKSLKSCLVNTN